MREFVSIDNQSKSKILDDPLAPWLVACMAALISAVFFTHETSDHVRFLNPWMAQTQSLGWRSLAGEFANYSPPYIYFMYLVSGLEPSIGNAAALKLINLPFLLAAMIAGYRIVAREAGPQRGLLAAVGVWALPTVLANSFIWGQCDIVYTSLLLWHLNFLLEGRLSRAAILFGAAVAFKLQAIFLGPLFLYVVLEHGRALGASPLRVGASLARCAAAVLLTYGGLMLPAWIAGRPIVDLLLVYFRQADVYDRLSMNAPNLWYAADWFGVPYDLGTLIGLVLAAVGGLALALWSFTRKVSQTDTVLLAATAATWMPFLLPKMHDRYMFPADVLILLIALIRPRFLWVAALAQVSSLAAYGGYFGAHRFLGGFDTPWVGVAAYTVVAAVLLREALRLPPRNPQVD